MTFRKTILVSAALLASAALQPAFAQATFSTGANVSDTAGGAVGTITSVEGDYVVLKTDKHEVRLPKSSFTAVDNGFIMAMTQAQVNAAVEQSLAKADSLVTVGAMVRDTSGDFVGSIQKVEGELATLRLSSGSLVALPVSAFGPGASGPVVGMSAAELEAAGAASAAAATPATDATAEATADATAGAETAAAVTTDATE